MLNIAKEVLARIDALMEKKQGQLAEIQKQLDLQRGAEAEARAELDAAAEALDFEKHQATKKTLDRITEMQDMLCRRINQLSSAKLVTETESDEVIDALLGYEQDLAAKFRVDVAPLLAKLKAVTEAYRADVDEAEAAISTWTNRVHPNYRSFAGTIYSETGSSRSPRPVAVHLSQYLGSAESYSIANFVQSDDVKKILTEYKAGDPLDK